MIKSSVSFCVASSASSSCPPPATRLTQPAGNPAATAASEAIAASTALECAAVGGAAQHDRVASLQAQRGGVDRDVGARLVDDRDHAERHAHLAHVEAVGQPPALDHLPDGVGQRGDRAYRGGDRGDPRGVEREAVEQRLADRGLAPGVHVELVGGQDLGCALDQRVRDREQRGVLDGRVHRRELPGRAAGGAQSSGIEAAATVAMPYTGYRRSRHALRRSVLAAAGVSHCERRGDPLGGPTQNPSLCAPGQTVYASTSWSRCTASSVACGRISRIASDCRPRARRSSAAE